MLPVGARAVILLVNSLQIMLPGPAFVEQGRCWMPARAPLQRLGYTVKWKASERQLLIGAPGQEVMVTLSELPAAAPPTSVGARRLGQLLYVPLVALRTLGLGMQFAPAERTLQLRRLEATPREASLAAILADPVAWTGRMVLLRGEYLGWSPYPYCYATADSADVAVGDFVLRNEGGAIYCRVVPPPLKARPSLGPDATERPPLAPYDAIGRRLVAVGRISLAPGGRPRLDAELISSEVGLAGVTCCLRLDRSDYRPGERVSCSLLVHNPGRETLVVPTGRRGADLSVASPEGIISVVKLSMDSLTLRPSELVLAPGFTSTLRHSWPIADTAVPGVYQVVAHLGEGLESYPASFQVTLPVTARGLGAP